MPIYPDRKNGKLTGRFRVEVTHEGRRKRGRVSSMKEAKRLEADLLRELKTGVPAPVISLAKAPSGMTLADAQEKAKGILWDGQSTERNSIAKLDRIVSLWGQSTNIDTIDANKVDELVQFLKDNENSDSTINRYLACVSAFLKFCKSRGHRKTELPDLPWRVEQETRIRWLTYAEEQRMIELLPPPLGTIVYLGIRTGMRVMEILTLKKDQVMPRMVHLWKTKNNNARSIPISEELHDLLWPLVHAGAMPDYWHLRWEWDKARERMGLKNDPTFVFHACRHTYATRAIEAGVNIRVLQKLMGHKTIQTTLRYAHVSDSTLSDAVEKMFAFHEQEGQKKVGQRPRLASI